MRRAIYREARSPFGASVTITSWHFIQAREPERLSVWLARAWRKGSYRRKERRSALLYAAVRHLRFGYLILT